MPSGYEKSPDYGSPDPMPTDIKVTMLVVAVAVTLFVWWLVPEKPDCPVVRADPAQETDGKARLTLDRIEPGECVTIKP